MLHQSLHAAERAAPFCSPRPLLEPHALRPLRVTRRAGRAAAAAAVAAFGSGGAVAALACAPPRARPEQQQQPGPTWPQQRRWRAVAVLAGPGDALVPEPAAGAAPIVPDELPEGLRLEVAPDGTASDVEYDEAYKVVRIPLSATDGGRRTKLVMFTCNKCGGRSARLVNPIAWDRGAVFAQCQHCKVWHMLAANNPKIVEEIRYDDPEGQRARREAIMKDIRAARGGGGSDASSEASDGTAVGLQEGGDGGSDGADSALRQ